MRPENIKLICTPFGLALTTILLMTGLVFSQTTSVTYQGRLTESGAAANGNYNLQFALFDNSSGGTQVAATQAVSVCFRG
jgi:hypothetical protein